MGYKKLKLIIWIIMIILIYYYYNIFIGILGEYIVPGLRSLFFNDELNFNNPIKNSKSDSSGGDGLPQILFKDPFPPEIINKMNILSEQVQGQMIGLNTLIIQTTVAAILTASPAPAPIVPSMTTIGSSEKLMSKSKMTTKNSTSTTTTTTTTIFPCKGPKIRCGSPIDCELGCQIHHMMTCLIISYTTNRTLVPTWKNWPYSEINQKWGSLFQPIGFNCPFDRDTGLVIWHKKKIEIATRDLLEYPFSSGFTIPEEIGSIAKRLGVDLFHWWVGQFVKFTLRLHPLQQRMIYKYKNLMRFSSQIPTVGILVRRRDKIGEKKKTTNSLDKYMTLAKKYFTKYENNNNIKLNHFPPLSSSSQTIKIINTTVPFIRRIFLATDDKTLLMLARKQYPLPKWEILGFQRTIDSEDIIKDIFLLSECDFVLCSFSSDICRLVSELMESKKLGGGKRVKSLDYKYFYDIPDFGNKLKYNLL